MTAAAGDGDGTANFTYLFAPNPTIVAWTLEVGYRLTGTTNGTYILALSTNTGVTGSDSTKPTQFTAVTISGNGTNWPANVIVTASRSNSSRDFQIDYVRITVTWYPN